ncbi:MAG TPA: polymer-forming cytoskeletal protein [Firmicutes bacterium]|nr:hypothetical protein [Bacillota bacterium]HHY98430.1 polymer-forming cytoskeletal protein [Bacillota bacterium]
MNAMSIRKGPLGFRLSARAIVISALILILTVSSVTFAESKRSGGSFVFGGSIHVDADEVVEGGVVSMGGKVTVDGRVIGDAVSIGGPVEVNGTVEGDVVSVGSRIYLGEKARVTGDVTSVGGSIERSPGAVVQGDVTTSGFPFTFRFGNMIWPHMRWAPRHMPWEFFGAMWIIRLIGALVLSLAIVAIWPNHTAAVASAIEAKLGRITLVGLVAWLLLVPSIIILAITLIGIPLIPLWVLFYIVAAMFGHAAVSILVGDRVAKLANATMTQLVKVLVGALIIALLGWVPGLGALVAVVVGVIGLGGVLETRFGTNKPWFPSRQPQPPQQ